jgi:hypothetical protein
MALMRLGAVSYLRGAADIRTDQIEDGFAAENAGVIREIWAGAATKPSR